MPLVKLDKNYQAELLDREVRKRNYKQRYGRLAWRVRAGACL